MARRRRSKKKDEGEESGPVEGAEAEDPSEDQTEAPSNAEEQPAADTSEPEQTEQSAPQETPEESGVSFDKEASDRMLESLAAIHAATHTAMQEATLAAAPFLTFAQKSRIGAIATDFETRRLQASAPATALAAPRHQTAAPSTESITREEIERIVSHRIEIAVQDALKGMGVSPDATIPHQIERVVETQLSSQEHKLLDYVKRHLTDSLEMLETTLEERIADYLEAAEFGGSDRETEEARAEVDAKVEEAREALLQNIDEVREVSVGFDIANFASQIVEINEATTGSHGSISDDMIEMAGEDEEVELGGDDEGDIELGGDDEGDIELGGDDEGAEDAVVAGDDVEAAAEDVEVVAEEADDDIQVTTEEAQPAVELDLEDEAETAAVEVAVADVEGELGDDDLEIDAGDDVPVEISLDSAAADAATAAQTLDLDEEEDAVVAEIDGNAVELDDEEVEEISIIKPVDDGPTAELDLDSMELVEVADDEAQLAAGFELDLGEDDIADEDEDEEVGLITLGAGPEDLQAFTIDDDVDVEISDEPEEPQGPTDISTPSDAEVDDSDGAVERYLQRAAEMRNRRQAAAAMELYSKVLDLDDDNYEAHIGRGVLNLEAKDYKRAVEEFSRAEKIDPSRPASALGLAEVHFHRKQFNKAIRHYTQCLKLDDKLAQAYCNRGLSYYYQKNFKKAFLDLMRAYDIDPELPNIKKYLKLVRNKVKSEKG